MPCTATQNPFAKSRNKGLSADQIKENISKFATDVRNVCSRFWTQCTFVQSRGRKPK